MVLIDPFAYLPWYFRIFTAGEFGRRAYQTTFAGAAGRRITNWILRKKQTQDADFMAAFSRVDHAVTHRYLEWFARFGSLEPYRVLSLPIDIAVGEHTFAAVRKSVCFVPSGPTREHSRCDMSDICRWSKAPASSRN